MFSRRFACASTLLACALVGCKDSQISDSAVTRNDNTGAATNDNGALTLTGAFSDARQDIPFLFQPHAAGQSGKISFSIQGLPAWGAFNKSTGAFWGTPTVPATLANIRISASDTFDKASLPAQTLDVAGDPLRADAWHLKNTGQKSYATRGGTAGMDLNVQPAWADGITGAGVRVAVSDSGLEIAHPDLTANILAGASRDYRLSGPSYAGDPSPTGTDGDHGTSVSGLIAARGWNGIGSRGVAPEAGLAGLNYVSEDVSQDAAKLVDQANGDFDVFNQSWGYDAYEDSPLSASYEAQLAWAVAHQRNSLGSVFVKAAGNSFVPYSSYSWMTLDSNSDPTNTTPYTVVVGALNAKGNKSSYSSIGSCLWVSAPGGEYGDDDPAMVTTDRAGCDKGYAVTSATTNAFEKGGTTNAHCDYTSTFNGTSSATPVVSGVVALILQANPQLSWREVKHILASTADLAQPTFAAIANRSVDTPGYVWDAGWVTNAAGFHFHNYFGFGRVNAGAAVAMARSFTAGSFGTFKTASADSGTISVAIPDDSLTGANHSLNVATALTVEAVVVEVTAEHPYSGDMAIELTSPSGTKSILLHANNAFADDTNLDAMRLLSNAFYGESSVGAWKLKVLDSYPGEGGTRKLTRWKVKVYGR